MKEISLICAAILLCGGLAGCGNNNQSNTSSKDSSKISSLKAENSRLKSKKHSSHKNRKRQRSSNSNESKNNTSVGSTSKATNGNQSATNNTQQSNANSVVRDKDGRVVYPDGTRGPVPSPYKEGTPKYDQWHASVAESIRSAYNEPNLQLGPEPRANNGQ